MTVVVGSTLQVGSWENKTKTEKPKHSSQHHIGNLMVHQSVSMWCLSKH